MENPGSPVQCTATTTTTTITPNENKREGKNEWGDESLHRSVVVLCKAQRGLPLFFSK